MNYKPGAALGFVSAGTLAPSQNTRPANQIEALEQQVQQQKAPARSNVIAANPEEMEIDLDQAPPAAVAANEEEIDIAEQNVPDSVFFSKSAPTADQPMGALERLRNRTK